MSGPKNDVLQLELMKVLPNIDKALPHALLRFGDCLPVSVDD
jgi:hypothetical protein